MAKLPIKTGVNWVPGIYRNLMNSMTARLILKDEGFFPDGFRLVNVGGWGPARFESNFSTFLVRDVWTMYLCTQWMNRFWGLVSPLL